MDFIEYALLLLAENQWADADDLSAFFKIAYPSANKLPDVRKACEKGWQNGCLEKLSLNGKAVYRLAALDPGHDRLNPATFLTVKTELVRKGLLLFAEKPKDPWQKTAVLERLRFMFPAEFAAFLPPPAKPLQVDASGANIRRVDFLREKLAEIIETPQASPPHSPKNEERLHIPFEALESICQTCKLHVSQKKLVAQPDLVLISYASKQMASSPVLIWLQKHHKLFGQIVATIKKKEGKTVVHDNLMIAAIKDLSLRVLLEKKFSDSKQVVTLADEFISFPLNLMPEIQKIVIKSGHAVKYVAADE